MFSKAFLKIFLVKTVMSSFVYCYNQLNIRISIVTDNMKRQYGYFGSYQRKRARYHPSSFVVESSSQSSCEENESLSDQQSYVNEDEIERPNDEEYNSDFIENHLSGEFQNNNENVMEDETEIVHEEDHSALDENQWLDESENETETLSEISRDEDQEIFASIIYYQLKRGISDVAIFDMLNLFKVRIISHFS